MATPTGGTAPYTYLWALADLADITITAATSASTNVTANVNLDDAIMASMYCTVTDSASNIVQTNQVSLTFENNE